MSARFTCNATAAATPLPHFWEVCVGSGRAALALRSDWQAQLARCRTELGFRHARFHGILDDDIGVFEEVKDQPLYSFHNVDLIYDFLRSIDMRPIVELSFMPRALASGDQAVFHYRAHATPPADYDKWAALVSRLAKHWIERYGAGEVLTWPIEVWNEPNMESFWPASREDYFHLYEVTWKALKHVHPDLRMGGPVTAKNAWIGEFLAYCAKANVPPDFISTHTYPTDAFGKPGDDTETALSESHLGILREQAESVRQQVGDRPLFYTEWSTSSNPRDALHDEPYAAAYLTQTMLDMGELVQAYSWWTFTDIFAENYFPSKAFQGGFGLLTIHGVAKPVYRAFEILHGLGDERLAVKGRHDTVKVWVVRAPDRVTVVIVNLALPRHPVESEDVDLEVFGLPLVARAEARRVDADHANAKARWKLQGEPRYPTAAEIAAMNEASCLEPEAVALRAEDQTLRFAITVAPQSVTAVDLLFAHSHTKKGAQHKAAVPPPHPFSADDEALLDRLQAAAFGYFTRHVNGKNGLVADSSKRGSAASIAATGFALSCYPVAAERGWLTREDAAAITLRTLKFFEASRQGEDVDATGHKGLYYHFLDMTSGRRALESELSTIDTALLLAGMLTAAQYFGRKDKAEQDIRALATRLFDRVDWHWTLDGDEGEFNQSWKPGQGFKKDDWDGFTEALLMYVLAAAPASSTLPKKTYTTVAEEFHWRHNAGLDWIHATPLFIHLFPQAWMDLRGLDDGHVSRRGDLDYFSNTQRAIAVQRDYAFLNPHGFAGYGRDIWGLSACAGPHGARLLRDGRTLEMLGYAARGVPAGLEDDGTLVPWGAATCVAHEPETAMAGVRALLAAYPDALQDGRFVGAINPSLPGDTATGWVAPACFGIDQGLVVMMIENARTGLIWELTRNAPIFRDGLKAIGFKGGWLESA
jgi:xylan 1,4-beta-xylosidase